jgi:hypothetical protein
MSSYSKQAKMLSEKLRSLDENIQKDGNYTSNVTIQQMSPKRVNGRMQSTKPKKKCGWWFKKK